MGEEENEKKDLNRWNYHIPHFLRIHSLLPLTLFLTVLAPPWLLMEERDGFGNDVKKRVLGFFFFYRQLGFCRSKGLCFFFWSLLLCGKDTDRTTTGLVARCLPK